MSEMLIEWRVMPRGRVAHQVTWNPNGDRYRYNTACGTAYIVSYVDDVPNARHCRRCEAKANRDFVAWLNSNDP